MKRLDEKFADTEDYDDDRVPTPPGKRRVAFRGQYIFVTDDEEEYSEVGIFLGGERIFSESSELKGWL